MLRRSQKASFVIRESETTGQLSRNNTTSKTTALQSNRPEQTNTSMNYQQTNSFNTLQPIPNQQKTTTMPTLSSANQIFSSLTSQTKPMEKQHHKKTANNDSLLVRVSRKVNHLVQIKFKKRTSDSSNQNNHPNKKRKTSQGFQISKTQMKFASFNLHGLEKREEFASELAADVHAMFFCESMSKNLIETNSHFTVDNRKIYSRNAVIGEEGGRPSGGIGFIVDDSIRCEVNLKINNWMGTLTIGSVRLIGVYLKYEKNAEHEHLFAEQLADIQNEIDKCREEQLDFIIIGDFNVDLRKEGKHKNLLSDFIIENHLKADDHLYEQSVNCTFKSSTGQSWVDHCLSSMYNKSITDCKIYTHEENDSDHHPIIIKLSSRQRSFKLCKRRLH